MLSELHWLRPLWWLALPVLALLWWWRRRLLVRDEGPWAALVDAHLRPAVLRPGARSGALRQDALVALGLLLLVAALAGPVWQRVERPVLRLEQAHVLLLDLSPSMQRADVAPSRLGRAHFELLDLLAALDEGHTGLVAFGAEPFLVAPLTSDTATLVEQVPALTPAVLPVQGATRPALAIEQARGLLERAGVGAGTVVLITDGVADALGALSAARSLAGAGHRLAVLAVVADPDDARLAPWRRLATAGGGELVVARADDADLRRLLPGPDPEAPRASPDAAARPTRWRDDGPWMVLALLPLAALAGRRGWLGLLPVVVGVVGLCGAAPGTAGPDPSSAPQVAQSAWRWADLWHRRDQQAVAAFLAGAAADGVFDDPRWQAAARYQGGQYEAVLALLHGQFDVAAHYNRGNALARLGRWREAIAEYDAALVLDPGHGDAQHNRALLRGLLNTEAREGGPAGRAGGDVPATPGAGASDPTADGVGEVGTPTGGMGAAPPPAAAGSAPAMAGAPGDAGAGPVAALAANAGAQTGAPAAPAGPAQGQSDTGGLHQGLLRQVVDDPGGLLRERFMLQYLRRHDRTD